MNATIEPPLATVQTDAPLNGAKTLRPPATAEQRQQVISLHQQRKTKREIVAITGLSWSQVELILQKFRYSGENINPADTSPSNGAAPLAQPPEVSGTGVGTADPTTNLNKQAGPLPVTEELKNQVFNMFRDGKLNGEVCRAAKLTIYQVKTLRKRFNQNHPLQPWEAPEHWLETQGDVLTESKLAEKAGKAPVWFLVQALYSGGRPLEGIMSFCGDPEQLVTDTMTRQQWFEQVSKLLLEKGTLRDAIEKKWGPIIEKIRTPKGYVDTLAPAPYGVYLLHQLNLRYVPSESSFYRYNPDLQDNEKSGTWEYVTLEEVERDIFEWVIKREITEASLEQKQILQALFYMRPMGIFPTHHFSTNPLHVRNGMLFIEEGDLYPSNPAYFSRTKLPVQYDANAGDRPTRFMQFLDEAGLTEEDKDLMQLWCGFVLLGNNSVHKIMLINGDAGSGKSTFTNLLERMLGHDSIATLNIERLDDRFELGSFYEKRLLVAKDVSSDALNSRPGQVLKALSGDSLIKAEIKHQNRRVSLKGPFHVLITSNADLYIKIRGDADAWNRRLIIIKFHKKKERDTTEPNLSEIMFCREGDKILNWMIKGAIRARVILEAKEKKAKFPQSDEQTKRVNELLRLSDSVKSFVLEELQSDAKGKITTAALFEMYENYCARNRVLPAPRGVFEREIVLRIQEAWGGEKVTMTDFKTGSPCRGYHGVSQRPKSPPATKSAEPAEPAPAAPLPKPADITQISTPAVETNSATQAPPIQASSISSPTEQTPSDDVPY